MSNKKTNARIEKWREMLNGGLFKDKQLLHSRIYKGIPSAIRQLVWPELIKLPKYIQQRDPPLNYDKLVNSLSKNVYEIGLDIPRTFPEDEDSKYLRKSLNNVLKAISIAYPRVGYCQGMNFPSLRILQVLDDETTFWLLDYLFKNDHHIRNNFIDPMATLLQNYVFQKLLFEKHPKLYKNLQSKGIQFQTYTMKWFINLYSSLVSQQNFNRLFEIYLIQGWPIMYSFGLVLIGNYEKQLLEKPMEDCHYILGKQIFKISDIDQILLKAQKLNPTFKKIQNFEKQYANIKQNPRSQIKESQIKKREQKNIEKPHFHPQSQNIDQIVFQNQSEDINFEILCSLKNNK